MRDAKLLAAAVLAGGVSTWIMRRIALRFGIVNLPNPIVRDHVKPVPYLGGLGVVLGTVLPLSLFVGVSAGQMKLLYGFVAFSVVGLVDDLFPLSPSLKFALQSVVAGTLVVVNLHSWTEVGALTNATSWIEIALATFWLVTVVNAMNFIDVCDGLAASVAAVTLLCWGWLTPSPASPLYVAVGGACLGFLIWNRPPARIYLGDCGSHGLGFLMGAAALDGFAAMPRGGMRLSSLILCTGVPLFELVFITAVRIRKGLPWWKGSPDHFAMRLQRAGLGKSLIDLLAAASSALLWMCGMAVIRMSPVSASLLLLILLTAVIVCWKLLLRWEA